MKEHFKNSLLTHFVAGYCAFALLFFVSTYLALEELFPVQPSAGASGRFVILALAAFFAALGLVLAVVRTRRLTERMRAMAEFAREIASDTMPSEELRVAGSDELGALEAALNELTRTLAQRLQAIEGEGERIRSILGCMIEGLIVLDTRGQVVLLNQAAQDMFGLPRGTSLPRMSPMEISRHPEMDKLIRQVVASDKLREPLVREIAVGNKRWFEVSATKLQNRQGISLGSILVLHDVTELKRLEEIRADFVANVSHEMRTPLTAIQGYAETLLHDAAARRKNAKKFLGIITHHSGRLGRLIDDLLTLSDLETGNVDLRMARVALSPMIDDVLKLFDDQAHKGEVRVGAEIAPGTPDVVGDIDRLQQLLINLVDNAIKYTPPGGSVVVRAQPVPRRGGAEAARVELAVADSGCGIPEKDLTRLTERFYRVDKARSRELGGTGLGLAIVKHIVQAHGGELVIESQLQKGTTVQIKLPAASAESTAHPENRMPGQDITRSL